jgi:hypothetical protein
VVPIEPIILPLMGKFVNRKFDAKPLQKSLF